MLLTLSLGRPAPASEVFRVGELEGIVNLSAGYGILARVEKRDYDLVGVGNGGTAPSVNGDDGNLNYDRGIVANQFRATAEVALRWKALSAFVRGYGFYDFETELGGGRRTELSDDGRRVVGSGGDVQDAYLSANFDLVDVPVQLRVGKQVLNWGETSFARFGIDVVSPLDLVAATMPTTTADDLYVRQGMIWGVANLTEAIAIEAFYQFDWEPVGLPPVGSFFSADDMLGVDVNAAFEGFGQFSDQGTDLDAAFDPTLQPLGFDPDFMRIPSSGFDDPDDQGQFGVAIQAFLPILNASKLALHFVNYHSRLPLVNFQTADAATVATTSDAAVDARAATYGIARPAAEQLAISDLANATRYEVVYPEDIQMLGVAFSTATATTGTLVAGELSHHFNWPLQTPREEVLVASLSPVQFTSPLATAFRSTSLGSYGADQTVKGWFDVGKTQLAVNLAQFLGPRLGASQTFVSFDAAWVHMHDLPGSSPFDEDSWGYRIAAGMTYDGIFGGISVRPRLLFTHDVDGITPGPGGAFVEDRKVLSAVIDLQYTQRWTATLGYAHNFGGVRIQGVAVNVLEDRDAIRMNVTFHY